ncbi:DUF1428 domain-containing protein [Celeribacter indicus]|uniref:RNA signal recognition particle 4.5S RNA n=1 Tax=Celeribacter indicus TaxID=1208324 RepID=A0A0B5DSG8_9RHOB|nr:DUF1428 domain-containing protein [Celeribacter indicus]AJE45994.1 hypothetical protein P73_1279 [Celeribacter indicus]SDW65736.1 Uncharacterized conserved protein YbaA, DUF1428 family [Celeribacter indicus]
MSYVQGFLVPVRNADKEAYIASARKAWPIFREYGASACYECWGDEVPEGEVTSFPMAVKLEEDETVVFSWILWPDKTSCDSCVASMESDERWTEMGEMPFDGKRMIYGGFSPVFEGS